VDVIAIRARIAASCSGVLSGSVAGGSTSTKPSRANNAAKRLRARRLPDLVGCKCIAQANAAILERLNGVETGALVMPKECASISSREPHSHGLYANNAASNLKGSRVEIRPTFIAASPVFLRREQAESSHGTRRTYAKGAGIGLGLIRLHRQL
jgi:hypothetical protein